MRLLTLLLVISSVCLGQTRTSAPLPYVSKKPSVRLQNGITGWARTTDGQWLSADNKIPLNIHSRDKEARESNSAELGMDNFSEWQQYSVLYGKDTLVMLVKLMQTGAYGLPETKRKWKDESVAWYFIMTRAELEKSKSINQEKHGVIEFELLDAGKITGVKRNKVSQIIHEVCHLNKVGEKKLVLTYRILPGVENDVEAKIQFFWHLKNNLVGEVEAVNHNALNSKADFLGTLSFLDHLYYETTLSNFHQLLIYKKSDRFLK